MSLSVPLSAVLGMLHNCAKGATVTEKKHHYWVSFNGRTYRSLSKGKHGARTPQVEIGDLAGLLRQLGIDYNCARREIPQLPKK